MIDLYLRARTPNALAKACPFLRDDDGEWITSGDGWALDVIGQVVTDPGTYDDEGVELTPPTYAPGFHANLRCTEEIAEQVPERVRVYPTNPQRVWA